MKLVNVLVLFLSNGKNDKGARLLMYKECVYINYAI